MIEVKKLFDIEFGQKGDIEINDTCDGNILVSPSDEGRFWGSRLKGEVLPVGAGLTFNPADGRNDISASLVLKTDDGSLILMSMDAILTLSNELEEEMLSGREVRPDMYYYKGIVKFRTGAGDYKWLERKICICEGIIESWEKLKFAIYMI